MSWQSSAVNYWPQRKGKHIVLTLVMMRGAQCAPPQSVLIFLPKISPPDQTLRPTCILLILALLYHEFFFLLKISI